MSFRPVGTKEQKALNALHLNWGDQAALHKFQDIVCQWLTQIQRASTCKPGTRSHVLPLIASPSGKMDLSVAVIRDLERCAAMAMKIAVRLEGYKDKFQTSGIYCLPSFPVRELRKSATEIRALAQRY